MSKMHPKLKEILDMPGNPDAVPVETQDPDEARAEWKADMAAVDAEYPQMADVADITLPTQAGDLAARCYVPDGLADADRPCLIYYHGGGFIRGDLDTHDSICRVLAKTTPCMVISVEYRKPPEFRFPAAFDDAYAAADYIAANAAQFNVNPARIAVAGDSAGGNLAAAVCLGARDRRGPSIAAQLLIYPVTDLVSQTQSKRLFSSGYLLDSMPFYISSYLGPQGDGADPLASPLLADSHASLPPAVVITAGFDPLRDEGVAYAEKLEKAGGDVIHTRYPDMIHGFVSLRGILEEADQALELAGAQLAARLCV